MPALFTHSFLPTAGRQPRQKLEYYAKLYAGFTSTIQGQGDAMRHDMETMQYAYDQVAAEFTIEQRAAKNNFSDSSILADLNEYARLCNMTPNSFKDHVRVAFAASCFVQVLMLFVIGRLGRNDREWVLAQATQLMSSNPNRSIPSFAPAISRFRSDNAAMLPVTPSDVAYWRSNPRQLVGNCFVTNEEILRRTFVVQDYYLKRTGPQYEVVFEDTGLEDVSILDTDSLLSIVGNSELVSAENVVATF